MEFATAGDDLGVEMLGGLFDGGIESEERFLGTEELFDAGAEFEPDIARKIEAGAEI